MRGGTADENVEKQQLVSPIWLPVFETSLTSMQRCDFRWITDIAKPSTSSFFAKRFLKKLKSQCSCPGSAYVSKFVVPQPRASTKSSCPTRKYVCASVFMSAVEVRCRIQMRVPKVHFCKTKTTQTGSGRSTSRTGRLGIVCDSYG